jgi:hypothetical protein
MAASCTDYEKPIFYNAFRPCLPRQGLFVANSKSSKNNTLI